jgi:hypothetical protein
MACQEKAKLVEIYVKATETFLDSIVILSVRTSPSQKADFERLKKLSDANRMKSEDARASLERHLASHDC